MSDQSVMVSLRKQLLWRRSAAGMTAEQLAVAAGEGLTRSIIANIESGRKGSISIGQFIAICRALGANPLDLAPELAPLVPGAEHVASLERRLLEIAELAREV